jgi:hypothetical protein
MGLWDSSVQNRGFTFSQTFQVQAPLELVFSENLIEHDFDVMAGMPVAVVIESAGLLQHAMPVPAPIIKTNVPMKQTTAPGFTGRCELLFSSIFLLCRFSF